MKCEFPFHSIAIQPNGDITPCCAFTGSVGKVDDIKTIPIFLDQNEQLKTLRDNENNGVWTLPSCRLCESTSEETSRKSIFNKTISPYLNTDGLLHTDISFGNICNLSCAMCTSKYSSKLKQIEKSFKERWLPISDSYELPLDFLDKFGEVSKDLKLLEIKGGEPLLYPEHLKKLFECISEECEVNITTNFTQMNDELFDLLSKIKNLKVFVSIDGVDDTYEWIRGYDFAAVEDKVFKYTSVITRFNFCTSIFNIGDIENFITWTKTLNKKIPISFSLIAKERHLSPLLSPKKDEVLERLSKITFDCKKTQRHFNILKNYLKQEQITDDDSVQKFYSWFSHLESVRKYMFPFSNKYYLPEINYDIQPMRTTLPTVGRTQST